MHDKCTLLLLSISSVSHITHSLTSATFITINKFAAFTFLTQLDQWSAKHQSTDQYSLYTLTFLLLFFQVNHRDSKNWWCNKSTPLKNQRLNSHGHNKRMGERCVLGITPAPKILQGQILCSLDITPLGETIN